MAKRKKHNTKKVNKELDKLLKEKRNIEDITMLERNQKKDNNSKIANSNKNNNAKNPNSSKKSEPIVVPERKNTAKKKEAIVTPERNTKTTSNTKKKNYMNKRRVVVSQTTKQNIKKSSSKTEVSEHTLRLNQLENDMRNLYDEADQVIESIKKEQEKTDKITVIEEPATLVTDVVVRGKEDEELSSKRKISSLSIITIILFVIFILLLIAFIAFLVYVCTY